MAVKITQWWPDNITERVNQVAEKYGAKMVPGELDEAGKKLQLRQIMAEHSTPDEPMEEAFYMIDLSTLEYQIRQWVEYLPRVRPFYAYKCNGSPVILDTLAALGTGFDCASMEEFEHVLRLDQKMDAGKDIIFANPCKQVSHIKSAAKHGMQYVTFDNEAELPKIKKNWPDAKVVLRIVTDDSKSICEFSSKYGAQLDYCPRLIDLCIELGLDLVGVSFHIGSGCGDVSAFAQSVRDARGIFDLAAERGVTMNLLDIGGGFPGDKETKPSFRDIANEIRPVIDDLFDESVQVIAEPGRYFACASHTLACNIFAKREISFKEKNDTEPQREVQYYLNEGVYQSFNCLYFDHAVVDCVPMPSNVADENNESIPKRLTTVFGPTCDGLDCIAKRIELPEMQLGDWMAFFDFGAYTISASSAFNGFKTKKFVYIRSGAGS